MSLRLCTGSLGLLAFAGLAAAPAAAHHSFAMFDNMRSVTLHGTVNYYQWTNPHAYLQIQADDGKGGTKTYTLEMTSPTMLHRGGWSSRTVKAGDEVTAVMSPLRDGQPGGLLLVLTLPNGKQMLPGVPNAQRYKITS
jgi:hypothetical protein